MRPASGSRVRDSPWRHRSSELWTLVAGRVGYLTVATGREDLATAKIAPSRGRGRSIVDFLRGDLAPADMWTLVTETADSCCTGTGAIHAQSMVYRSYPEDSCHIIANKGYANSLASSCRDKSPQRQRRRDMAGFDVWAQCIG
jgi:hypothetical protein